jgi:hypothetical protein
MKLLLKQVTGSALKLREEGGMVKLLPDYLISIFSSFAYCCPEYISVSPRPP